MRGTPGEEPSARPRRLAPRSLRALAPALAIAIGAKPGIEVLSPSRDAGIPVAKISFLDGTLELASAAQRWGPVKEGARVKTGDRVRTGPASTTRVEFPFMNVVVGPSSVISVAASKVLSTSLEEGRIEEHAEGNDAIKLRTPEAEVRGRGRVVVRRQDRRTLVMVLDGRFRVQSGSRVVLLIRGVGTVVESGQRMTAVSLPPPPSAGLWPGPDPVYLLKGQAVNLNWVPGADNYHLQIFGIDSDEILLERDVVRGPYPVEIPWLGTFRWHVAARDERGLEGLPSRDGFLCMVEE